MIGQVINGKYRVDRLLGQGGMGCVYEAMHLGTGRRVALKVIVGGDVLTDRGMVTRFEREARAAGAIDTQHIVQVLDSGTDAMQGFPFMVMELLIGEDLQHLVERIGPLPPDLVMRIAAQACFGLQRAHAANVIHRDIKPANLYLARRDAGELILKVLDFGIAKIKVDQLGSSQNQGLTKTGSMLGSPLYMSPEQARGLKTIDHRTDLWSLGAVLYQALSGRTPHHGIDTLGQLIISICSEPPLPVQDAAPWVPLEVAAIVHRALTLDVTQRYSSAEAMLEDIRRVLPTGWTLHESMLRTAPPELRAMHAPRLALSVGPTRFSAEASAERLGNTQEALVRTARGTRSSVLPLLGVALAMTAGAFGWWRFSHPSVAESTTASGLVSTMPSSPTPSSIPSTEPAPPAMRQVRVTVLPTNAQVEIDGQTAEVTGGAVEVAGALGSTHRVRVASGGREIVTEVAIAEGGAMPSRVELGALAPKPMRPAFVGPTVSPPSGATGGVKGPAATSAKPSGATLDKKFE